MGVRLASVSTTTVLGSPTGGGPEVVACTTPAINLTLDGAVVFLVWSFSINVGVGATGVGMTIRRGTTATSPLALSIGATFVTASNNTYMAACFPDSPGIIAELQYSLGLTIAGGAAGGLVNSVSLLAFVL